MKVINMKIFEEYARVSQLIKDLEVQKSELNTDILALMNENGFTNEETTSGKFVVAWKKSFEYSTDTNFMEEQLKSLKKKEEAEGTAKVVKSTQYLRFLPAKEEEK